MVKVKRTRDHMSSRNLLAKCSKNSFIRAAVVDGG